MMKQFSLLILIISTLAGMLAGCATIIGGGKYYAHITVSNDPQTKIYYKDKLKGEGYAAFKAPRAESNAFKIILEKEGCLSQEHIFTQKRFRGWALVGTLTLWTVSIDGFPLPWGYALDYATGALWKPDIRESGITKTDYKHYNYRVEYTGCEIKANSDTLNININYDEPIDLSIPEEKHLNIQEDSLQLQ